MTAGRRAGAVLDASVVVDALTTVGRAGDVARRLVGRQARLHAPAILGAEVTSAVRALHLRGVLDVGTARAAVVRAAALRTRRYPFEPFAVRAWELRDTVTVYDAWYVALAEALDATLVSADSRLRRASGPRCPVRTPEELLPEGTPGGD